jgi:hypothetical protein
MKKTFVLLLSIKVAAAATAQMLLPMPANIKKAFTDGTRSADGKPGKNYWQNTADYNINVSLNPPDKTITGTETITYTNKSPNTLNGVAIKLILNIHAPGAARQNPASADYLTDGIIIDEYKQNDKVVAWKDPKGRTTTFTRLTTPLKPNESVKLSFKWHYKVSEESNREGKLDSTSFFLAYFYPRVAVYDDTQGWDFMTFTDAQEFYNEFNNYEVGVTVPKNFVVWGTGDLQNIDEVLQPAVAQKLKQSFTSNEVLNIVTPTELAAKNVTVQNATNTFKWKASNISDVAFCISDHYVWDAASVVVDKKSGRRSSCQSAYNFGAGKFNSQVKYIQHSLDWFSNNWPGVPYPFSKSTIIEGFADMEYPMMANDSKQEDEVMQRFIAEHEIAHTYFPFYMGINEHRYGFMDEGWTTAFENMIGRQDLGAEKANGFFKQFRVAGWASEPSEETQIPIITPTNILSGEAMGHNEYGKPALAYLALKDMLGDDVFRKSLHGFMERWNGKHPLPWDMFNSFSNLSGKDLSWYWHNWFFTNYYMDVALINVVKAPKGYNLNIKNIGGYAAPFDVVITYADGTKQIVHQTAEIWQKNQQVGTKFIATNKAIAHVKLDGGIWMDANTKDNIWGKLPASAGAAVSLDKYLGVYASKQIPIVITFTKVDDALVGEVEGQGKLTFENTGKDTFTFAGAGLEIIFNNDKNEMTLKQAGQEFLFTKK